MITILFEWQYLFALVACHNIGDFAFQSAWMAMEKGKNLEVLAYHVLTQATPFFVLAMVPGAHATAVGLVLHMALHATVDYLKGRGIIKTIWQDQLCHYVCMFSEHALGIL